MKLKIYFFFFILMFCNILSFAQNKVLTTDGKTLNAASVEINKTNITANVNGDNQIISKSDILVVVPDGKKGFTFRAKNGQKLKIRNRDIHDDYQGTDKPRIFAYKYLGGQPDIKQLYINSNDTNISFEEFNIIFKKQQKKLKTGNVVSISASVIILLIAFG